MRWWRCLAASSLLSLPLVGVADRDQRELWSVNLYFENDLFSETDRAYTNGLRVSFVSPDLSDYLEDENLPAWVRRINNRLTFFHGTRTALERNLVASLGQTIFTPEDIDRIDVDPDDRPYAGWLFGSLGYQTRGRRRQDAPEQLDSLEVRIGIVGPAALGKQAQDFIHDLRGFQKFAGWDTQLHNEPGILFLWEHKRKYPLHGTQAPGISHDGFEVDLITHSGVALGNVASYLNIGAELRAGWRIPNDFGTSAVRPGGDNSAPDSSWDPRVTGRKSWGVHAFAATDLRLVARNIFLDGNTFRNSHSVDKNHGVADFSLGISLIVHGTKMSYAQVFRTREFRAQDESHSYGSLSFSYTFRN